MKRIGLLFFDPYSINKGTAALAYSAVSILNEISKETSEKFEYVFLEPAKPINNLIDSFLNICDEKIPVKMKRCFPSRTLKDKARIFLMLKQYFESSKVDFILDIGEGDSYSDIYGKGRFYLFDSVKKFYLKKNIPFMICPQTLGPFCDKVIERKAIKTLKKVDILCSRDEKTTEYIKSLIPEKAIFQFPDFAFFLPYEEDNYYSEDFDSSKINVGINVSGLLWYGGYTQNNQFNLFTDYKKLTKSLIEYFLSQENVCIYLIPHVVHEQNTLDNDYPLCAEIKKTYRTNKIKLSPFFMTPIEAKNYISNLDFFIGARLHSTIAAFSSGVPVVPCAYSRKFTGLYIDSLSYNHVADLMQKTNDEVFFEIVSSYKKRSELKEEIVKTIKNKINPAKNLLKEKLKNFLF